ncbi:MAG: hypothetical protein JW744_04640 [Candidatus Diapherotrites archaeon]|uniref:Uncharacterized protein n=1 Tax=Candidatus Iainarchaeum sp. TaxID=3101447 RepID=A0A939C7J7_9ARCH|nr:hypothetical protein [Candidatus Diapherotrites archaeon]
MKCPKCGVEMRRVGLEQLSGAEVFATLECPACHYRTQQKQGRPGLV